MSACVPNVSVRLFVFVRVFSLSLCCLPTVMYVRTARFPLSGSLLARAQPSRNPGGLPPTRRMGTREGSLGVLRDRVDNQLSSLHSTRRTATPVRVTKKLFRCLVSRLTVTLTQAA
jgi:hypothetical protein